MTHVLIPAAAGFFTWMLLQLPNTPALAATVTRLRNLHPQLHHLITCPWCSGAWLTLAAVVAHDAATNHLHPVLTPLRWFAAAAVVGAAGELLPPADDQPIGA